MDVVKSVLLLGIGVPGLPLNKIRILAHVAVGGKFGDGRHPLFGNLDGREGGALQFVEFRLNQFADFFNAEFIHHVFEPRLIAVAFVAMLIENLNDGFADSQDVGRGQKVGQRFSHVRVGPQTAAHDNFESANAVADFRVYADVVDRSQPASFTAAQGDFEFARQVLSQRMPQKITGDGFGVRGDVELLLFAGAGFVAGGHVADGIAAGFPGGEAVFRQILKALGNIVDLDVMELNILPGGDV